MARLSVVRLSHSGYAQSHMPSSLGTNRHSAASLPFQGPCPLARKLQFSVANRSSAAIRRKVRNMLVRQLHDTRPQTTAHLAKTMAFLALSTTELEETLLKEVDSNPALEVVDELHCPNCCRRLRAGPCPQCAAPQPG